MANTIKLRRSSVQGTVPTTSQLLLGELGINTYDGKLFLKRSTSGAETGAGTSIVDVTADQTITLTGDVTGSGTGSFAATLANTTVVAGSYSNASLTVDAKGRLTAASSGTAPVTSVSGTAPIVSSGGATPAISISAATTSAAGSMSSADKSKLDGIAASATNTPLSSTTPSALGTAAVGSGTTAARADHVHAMPSASDVSALPLTFSANTITYGATVDLDMSARNGGYFTISLTGNLTLTTSNRAAGRTVTLRLICDATQRTLTLPAGWVFVGSKPANIAASKTGILSLSFFGTADTDCVAAYGVQA